MKSIHFSSYGLVFVTLVLILASCKIDRKHENVAAKVTYTCSMHPQIISDKPGKCPICGMDLVVFDRNNQDRTLTLSESQISLANIKSMPVGDSLMRSYTRVNGRIATDPAKTVYVSSKFAGRIDKMYVKETGVQISKGQPLFSIYSEELSALQKEYMVANAQAKAFPTDQRFKEIEEAAQKKLKLYGLSDSYIKRLSEKPEPNSHITIYADNQGMVAEITVQEGQYVNEGADVMRIENYTHLWAEAEVYAQSAPSIKIGQRVLVSVAGYQDKLLEGKVSFITPDLQNNTQIQIVRVEFSNVDNHMQPGAQVVLQFPVAASVAKVTIPVDAVIHDGKGAHVWIDDGKGKFVPRMVETGIENADEVEIKSGLEAGEKVVVSGAYLLYSEYILKKGVNPMAAHNH